MRRAKLSFLVLGPVEVSGLELPAKRTIAVELLLFLAFNRDRRLTAGEIIEALWPLGGGGREQVSLATFRSYVSAARRCAGETCFPRAEKGTYAIGEHVTTDWDRFTELVAAAETLEPTAACLAYKEALGLVRGPAFSGIPDERYSWAVTSGIVARIDRAVATTACALADLCLETGCPSEALLLLGRALEATKAPDVGDDLLTLAGATGVLGELERAWHHVVAALGPDALRLQRSYEAIRDRLRAELAPAD